MLSMSLFIKKNKTKQNMISTCQSLVLLFKHLLVNTLSIFPLLATCMTAVPTTANNFYLTGEASAFYCVH